LSHLQISCVRGSLDGIDRLAGKAVRSAENLHRADEVKLLDGRNNNHPNAAAFEWILVLVVALRRLSHGFAHYASQTADSTRVKQSWRETTETWPNRTAAVRYDKSMEDVARNQLGGPQNDCTFHAAKDEQNGLGMRQVRIYVVAAAIAFCPAAPHFACGGEQEDTERIALRIERSFAAPRDKVFGLWTDPQAVAQWFLPPENARWTEALTFAARPGGDFRLRLIAGDELYDLYGTFREVRAPEKLVLNWRWDKDSPLAGSPGDTEVTVEFFARGGRTDLVLTQRGFRKRRIARAI
jgi:uncharacterized protein YndB with AHSA1/START domain